jgi:hypothetical protein
LYSLVLGVVGVLKGFDDRVGLVTVAYKGVDVSDRDEVPRQELVY